MSTALITGASSGVGYHYAIQLAERKYNLVIVSNEQSINDVAAEISDKYKVTVWPLCLNLADTDAARRLFDYCQANSIEIEILICNAGIFFFKEFNDASDEVISTMTLLHVYTPTMLCKLFGNEMKKRRRGNILIMSSLSAWTPYPGISTYAVSKRYLKDFGRVYHHEMKRYGVGVTTICPGAINTGILPLDNRKREIAMSLGVMSKPEKIAKKALRAMFRNRICVVPGLLNKIAVPIVMILPIWAIRGLLHKMLSNPD